MADAATEGEGDGAGGIPDDDTGVGLTPSRVQLDLQQRTHTFPVTVFNATDGPRTISVAVVGLGHELDGSLRFLDPLAEVTVVEGDTEFTLDAGGSTEITFRAAFPNRVALYGAVLARIEPDDPDQAIATRTQVASLLLLRGPRPWDQSLAARDVGVSGRTDDGIELYADVENVGNAHVRPTGRFVVRQEGEQIAAVDLPGEVVLPGYARRMPATWLLEEDDDVTGEAEVELQLDDGSRVTRTVDLDAPGTSTGSDGGDAGPGGAVLEQPEGSDQTEVEGPRRVLLPLAALLILLALGSLWLMLLWKRREEAEEDEEDEPVAAGAPRAAGGDEGS